MKAKGAILEPAYEVSVDPMHCRKTCRRCAGPLFDGSQQETFPIAGIGSMHLHCARIHCQEHNMTLEQATPICKHWRSRGCCIYEVCQHQIPDNKLQLCNTWIILRLCSQATHIPSVCSGCTTHCRTPVFTSTHQRQRGSHGSSHRSPLVLKLLHGPVHGGH